MNTTTIPVPQAPAADEDLADQAVPGHGIPSQDPNPAAQLPLDPAEAEREANSVLAGGGVMVGAAMGGAVGSVIAGPVGAVVGGTVGAVAGALPDVLTCGLGVQNHAVIMAAAASPVHRTGQNGTAGAAGIG